MLYPSTTITCPLYEPFYVPRHTLIRTYQQHETMFEFVFRLGRDPSTFHHAPRRSVNATCTLKRNGAPRKYLVFYTQLRQDFPSRSFLDERKLKLPTSEVKMIDFGMAVKYDHGVWFKDMATRNTTPKQPLMFFKVMGLMEGYLYLYEMPGNKR